MDLLKKLVPVCPESFARSDVPGETEDSAMSIDDDGEDEEMKMEDSIVNKINQFAEDIKI